MSTPTDPTAGEDVEWLASVLDRHVTDAAFESGCRLSCGYDGDDLTRHMAEAILASDWLAARESAAATRARAEALREAADRVREFRDWYPLSVFPSLDEALDDDYKPSSERIAASSYRHAYGEVVPRNLRAWAAEIESDALAPDTAGESA